MQLDRNALILIAITETTVKPGLFVLCNHAENFRPFVQNSIQVSNFLHYNCIREGGTKWRESFWLPAFCLSNNLKKRLPGKVSKRKVVYNSHLKHKWLNSYSRNKIKSAEHSLSLVFRNAKGTHFLLLHLKLQTLIGPGKIKDFRDHNTTGYHILEW